MQGTLSSPENFILTCSIGNIVYDSLCTYKVYGHYSLFFTPHRKKLERRDIMKKIAIRFSLALLSSLFLLVTGVYAEQSGYKGLSRGKALITVQELKNLLDAGQPSRAGLAAESTVGV